MAEHLLDLLIYLKDRYKAASRDLNKISIVLKWPQEIERAWGVL